MSTARKFGRLQQKLFDSPEYLGLSGGLRAACRRFLLLAAADSPESNELEAAYEAAVCEARNLIATGLLTGIDLSDMELEPTDAAVRDTKRDAEDLADVTVEESSAAHPAATVTAGAPKVETFPEREVHEAATIFPMMPPAEIADLANDIKANGLRDDIITVEGKIADGRNRYSACRIAGVTPRFKEWDGEGSLISWVLSVNLHRRHLTDQQRALVAARAMNAFESEAEVRRLANLSKNKRAVDSAALRSREAGGTEHGKSAAKAAQHLRVSTRAVEQASRVLKNGDQSLVEAVTNGSVSLDAANAVSKLPHGDQENLVKNGTVKATAAEMRKARAPKPNDETVTTAQPAISHEPELPVQTVSPSNISTVGPRTLTPGTPEWAACAPRYVSEALQTIRRELATLPQLYHHVVETRVWETKGHVSWDDFCRAELLVRPESFAALLALCDL